MKLSKKIIKVVIVAFAAASIILFVLSKTILLKTFTELEINRTESSTSRIVKFIGNEADDLDALCVDYSTWDETYSFIKTKSPTFLHSNFDDLSAFDKSDVNFIFIMDNQGNLLFDKSLNCTSEQNLSINDQAKFSKDIFNLMNYDKSSSLKGIYITEKGPVILCSNSIYDSNKEKAPNGVFIVAKYLDRGEIDLISSVVGMDFTLADYNSTDYIYADKKGNSSFYVNNNDPKTIAGYRVMNDVFGVPVLTLKISLPKDIFLEANTSIYFLVLLLAGTCLLFVVLLMKFLNHVVIKRINNIKNTVDEVTSTGDLSLRLHDNQQDEISELTEKFNNMFEQLQGSNMKLLTSERKYFKLFSNMLSSFMYAKVTLDASNNLNDFMILEVNNSFAELFHSTKENLINKPGLKLLSNHLNKQPDFMKMVHEVAINSCSSIGDAFYIEKHEAWFYLTVYSTEKYHFAMMITDITDQKSLEQKIFNLAYYDTLTSLPNRKKLLEEIQTLIDNGNENFALMFIDLDNFKSINDSLGHDVGDYVLEKTAVRLKQLIDENIIIGRLGGDEFIIVIKNIFHISEAEALANKLYSILKPAIIYKGNELYIGASIGISFYPEDGTTLTQLMRNADTAMYAAKKNGGYSYEIYSRKMNDFALTELIMENNLRKALDNNQIIVYYQPITDLKTLTLLGFEALSRWNQNNKLVPPSQFIPLAKNIGEIANIDNWVLRHACLQCKIWHKQNNTNIYASVNISFKQLKEPSFIKSVMNALEDSELEPNYLNLEITEDVAMEDVELSINVLNKLKAKGVMVSLDDFGTGYSSLSYVNKLPIDLLKIDMSLINALDRDKKNVEIVRAIIVMSHSLGIKVLAEGVERESQLEILKEMDCDRIQGYIISKPIPGSDFETKFLI